MDLHGYQVLTWSLTGVILAAFFCFAVAVAFLRRRRMAQSIAFNQEEFITARRQVGDGWVRASRGAFALLAAACMHAGTQHGPAPSFPAS
jgi:succinate dehydrogenase/fumarate reductase cytochrome b subunit